MTQHTTFRRIGRPSEQGYTLVAVMFMLAVFTIYLAIALPRMSKEIQRDRERETVMRGKQYIRGIKMYYKKFTAFPPSVDALMKTNEIRFLRKKYKDPTTGKEEWKPVRFGQAKTQTLGFFGKPLAGGGGMPGLGAVSGIGGTAGNTNSPLGGSGSGQSSLFGNSGSTGDSGAAGTGESGSAGDAGSTGSGTGLTGQTFGGGGIIGFSPTSPKKSLYVFKKKDHYNEWEFNYDPLADLITAGGNTGVIGTPIGGSGSGAGTGIGTGGGGIGGSGGGGGGSTIP